MHRASSDVGGGLSNFRKDTVYCGQN